MGIAGGNFLNDEKCIYLVMMVKIAALWIYVHVYNIYDMK